MCKDPQNLTEKFGVEPWEDGSPVIGPCRKCESCRLNRVNDWVGRMLAEKATNRQTTAVTLTYRGNGPETAMLRYKDFQDFMKRARFHAAKQGHRLRYFVAGEYGSVGGRAHWHAILFGDEIAPDLPRKENVQWPLWSDGVSRGHVYFDDCNVGAFHYACKYIVKRDGDLASGAKFQTSGSAKGELPLGGDYLVQFAIDCAKAGLPLRKSYTVPGGVHWKTKMPRKYWVQSKAVWEHMQWAWLKTIGTAEFGEQFWLHPKAADQSFEKAINRYGYRLYQTSDLKETLEWYSEKAFKQMAERRAAISKALEPSITSRLLREDYPPTFLYPDQCLYRDVLIAETVVVRVFADGLIWVYGDEFAYEFEEEPLIITWDREEAARVVRVVLPKGFRGRWYIPYPSRANVHSMVFDPKYPRPESNALWRYNHQETYDSDRLGETIGDRALAVKKWEIWGKGGLPL